MWGLITSGLGWFFGKGSDLIGSITNKIVDLKIQQANAETQQQKDRLQAEIDALNIQAGVLKGQSERGELVTNMMRVGFALPFAIIIWKYTVHDKWVCPWWNAGMGKSYVDFVCTTDNLSPDLWWVCYAVICYLFVALLKK